MLIQNVTPGGHWIELDLVGARPQDNKARSNNSAIGARVEIKTGTVSQQFVVGVPSGPVAMPPLRIHAGLGENTKVDWLRIIGAVRDAEKRLEREGHPPARRCRVFFISAMLSFSFSCSWFSF